MLVDGRRCRIIRVSSDLSNSTSIALRASSRGSCTSLAFRDRELRDQATRASKSCFLCLCEGLPNEGVAMRHKYFTEARNSLAETVGAIDLAAAISAMREEDAEAIHARGLKVRRMLTALLR